MQASSIEAPSPTTAANSIELGIGTLQVSSSCLAVMLQVSFDIENHVATEVLMFRYHAAFHLSMHELL